MRSSAAMAILLSASSIVAQVALPNGVTVPKERFIVYIVSGNSEAEGQTTVRSNDTLRPLWDDTHPRLWNFNIEDNHNPGPHHTWVPAQGKNHAGTLAAYPDWLGPDMPLLKELVAQYPEEYYFGVLKIANQGDRLRKQYLEDEIGWGEEHQWTQITDAIAAVGPNTVTWGGFFTVFCDMETHDVRQGYDGADVRLDSMAYDAMELTRRLRTHTGSDLPLLFACPPGNYSNCIADGRRDVWDRLNTQLSIIPTLDTRALAMPVWVEDTAYVIEHYVDPNNGHFSGPGLVRLAYETVAIIKANGWVPPLGNDTQPPTAPADLAATSVGPLSLTLSWTASTDDVGVSSYTVYRDGDSAAATAATSVILTGLSPQTQYVFTVQARDYSGKLSPLSDALLVTTAEPGADMEPPTAPTGLVAQSVGLTGVTLCWSASTDNVGVRDYIVCRDGVPVDTVTAVELQVDGLSQQTTYAFTVKARDAAGNLSAPGGPLTVTTGRPVAFPFRVDVGGGAWGGYLVDKAWDGQGYGFTGTAQSTQGSGEVSGTDDDTVFHSLRFGADMGYRVAVPPGVYDVTLGFTEFWHPAGSRVFTPFVNGAAVTDGPIDVAALVGHRTAYLISACVEAADGLIDITFTHEGGDGSGEVPILNSLTVDNAPAYTIEGPTDQAVYTVGDTLHVRWDANVYLVTGTEILLSPDLGESWLLVNTEGAVFPSDPAWGDYPFVLPLQLAGVSLVGVPLSLKLNGYNGSFSTVMQGTFSVLPGASPVRNRTPGAAAVPHLRLVEGRRLAVGGVPSHSPATLEVHALNGALVCRRRFTGGGAATFSVSLPAGGTYIAVLTAAGTRQTVRLATR